MLKFITEPLKVFFKGIGVFAGLVAFGMAFLGVILLFLFTIGWYQRFIGPERFVFYWDEVPQKAAYTTLRQVDLYEGETFHYYYCDGAVYREQGTTVTNKRIIHYYTVDNNIVVQETPYSQIQEIELLPLEKEAIERKIRFHTSNQHYVDYAFGIAGNRDTEVINFITDQIAKNISTTLMNDNKE